MLYEKLATSENYPYILEIYGWNNCTGLLLHLERVADIKVLCKKSSWFGRDFYAKFEYQGQVYELEIPIYTPTITGDYNCDIHTFAELVNHVRSFANVTLLEKVFGGIRYMMLPPGYYEQAL
jgi:hypothetical protein